MRVKNFKVFLLLTLLSTLRAMEDTQSPIRSAKRAKTESGRKTSELQSLKYKAILALDKHIQELARLSPERAKQEFTYIINALDQDNKEYIGSILGALQTSNSAFLMQLIEQKPKTQEDMIRCYFALENIGRDVSDLKAAGYGNFVPGNALCTELFSSKNNKYLTSTLFKLYTLFCGDTFTEKEQLIQSAINGDIATCRGLLEQHIELVDATDDIVHFTPLTTAVKHNNQEIVKMLLKAGANANTPQGDGTIGSRYTTALMIAARAGNSAMVELLLNPDNYKSADCMPIIETATPATTNNQGSTFSDEGYTACMYAAENGDDTTIQQFIGARLDVVARNGTTMLMAAARGGNTRFVSYLLDLGLDIHAKTDVGGRTALMFATQQGHHEIVALLLERGADPAARTDKNELALHLAVEHGHHKIIKQLLATDKTIIDVQIDNGDTPLIIACSRNRYKDVKILLAQGAQPNIRSKSDGKTALVRYASLFEANTRMVKLLLAHGADANIIDKRKRNALMQASENWCADVVQLLIPHTNDINAQDLEKRTALHIASAAHDCDEIVSLLLVHGADMSLEAQRYWLAGNHPVTALDLAREYKHKKIAALLKQRQKELNN